MQRRGVNVVGSANMDLVVRSKRFPAPGETILGGTFSTFPGGKGANQAVAIGKLGGRPLFVSNVGTDAFGDELLSSLETAGVDVSAVGREREQPTGVALITVDAKGENTIIVASGANMTIALDQVRETVSSNPSTVLLVQLEIPLEAIEAAVECHEGNVLLNPAPARDLPDSLLARVDILTPNESECAALTGIEPLDGASLLHAGQNLLGRGVKSVVITRGAQGCALIDASGLKLFPAPVVQPVDTTAAGDAFSGALAHYISLGLTLEQAIPKASVVAALSVTRQGAQASMPSADEVESFIRSNSAF